MALRDNNQEIFHIEIDNDAKAYFLEMARWTKFISIFSFILWGLIFLMSIFTAIVIFSLKDAVPYTYSGLPLNIFLIFNIIVLIFASYPTIALYHFSLKIKHGLLTSNKNMFNDAIRYMKNYYKFIGITAICIIAIYGVVILVAIVSLAVRG